MKTHLPRLFKLSAYAVISFCALVPLTFIGVFQQTRLAQDTVNTLALNLATLSNQARHGEISPAVAVTWIRNHELVLWANYLKQNQIVAHAGFSPRLINSTHTQDIQLDPDRSFQKQLPKPHFQLNPRSEYRFILPISWNPQQEERLELGASYGTLFSAAKDAFVLSSALFTAAFIFLFGTVIFVDAYVSSFTLRVIRAIRTHSSPADFSKDLGIPQDLSPTFSSLMETLEHRTECAP
ncbi:hypothetical protein WDW37_12880 [Bdellovibrionota bacterium FG-1]